MPGTRNRCVDCHGSGRCSQCFGSGVNVHLNEVEPRCRPCYGTGLCDACDGTGRLSGEKLVMEMPLGLRCLISVFPVFMLYTVFIDRALVHWGGAFGAVGFCGIFLFRVWKNVKREDFTFVKSSQLPSIACAHKTTDQCLCPCNSGVQVGQSDPCRANGSSGGSSVVRDKGV